GPAEEVGGRRAAVGKPPPGPFMGPLWGATAGARPFPPPGPDATPQRGHPGLGGPPMPPARALAAAQSWLRDATTAEIERFAAPIGLSRRTPALGRTRPYADRPAFWAPFVLVGNG